jgi:hypothetical protein
VKRRTFFLASILLAVIALTVHAVARDQLVQGSIRKAKRIEGTAMQGTSYTPDPEAIRLSRCGTVLNKIGLAFTFPALACVVVALIRREPGWYSIPVMLLFADLAEQILL